ncbi:ABC transporter substrate-binding protein [Pseudodesulfovibrio sp. zrk46]|uniref:substrate-binding periplasmic protein n=1 Tax=Pseudodesulfovibrio sp. zrk46 TaxID=2725288 RepID=UPI001448E306|nr:ABC transporter substrate-binding protein [Pseudodesulfovibrio sp. zrk46]QJB57171.1 ABC transporter substrate-binding protein [Pseudodesulfovibrio sp. zrk46]
MCKIVSSLLVVLVLLVSSVASADEYVVMSGVYPPFTFNKGLRVGGVSVDTIESIMKMTSTPFHRKNIKLMPLKKAYADAETLPKRVILNVPRTPEVEEKFKWVGPVYFPKYVLIGKKGNEYTIATTEDVEKYQVGSIRGSDPLDTLIEEGVDPKKVKMHTSYVQPLLELKGKKTDLIAYSNLETAYLMRQMRIDPRKYKVAFVYKKVPLYFAFSKDTDDAKIKLYNDALASIKVPMAHGDTVFQKNLRKYVPYGEIK